MTKNVQGVLLKKSKLTTNGKPNLPAPGKLVEGELALNYAEGVETISTKNESGTVVTFSSDDYYTTKKLGSGFTGENSAKTVTDVINQNERITAAALNDLNANKLDTSAFTAYSGVVETTYVKKADVDQVIDSGTSASTDAVSTSAVYDFVNSHVQPSVNADWDETDETSPAFILNKPFGDECEYVTGYDGTVTLSTQAMPSGYAGAEFDAGVGGFVAGRTYRVTLDGDEFITTAVTFGGTQGTYTGLNMEAGAESPFTDTWSMYNTSTTMFTLNGGTQGQEVSIKVEELITCTTKTIDNKYLDTIWESGTGGGSATRKGLHSNAVGQYSVAEAYSCNAVGEGSHCESQYGTAYGKSSHAEGFATTAYSQYSHTEGYYATASGDSSHAEGQSTHAIGSSSHAEGNYTTASGNSSHAEGGNTTAYTDYSHAEGYYTIASGNSSHAEGRNATAYGGNSHAEGYDTTASGQSAHAEGRATRAYGENSHAEGNYTTASGNNSHTEGYYTIASGHSSHAEGNATTAYTDYSHAEGYYTIASGSSSHAEGRNTTAYGGNSHTEGYYTTASGQSAHAEGQNTIASADNAHAEGSSTSANGYSSHAEGIMTITNNLAEHASGLFNVSSSASTEFGDSGNTLFSVGNGTADDARHNAFEIRQNGDIYIVNKDGNDVKLQDEIGNIDVDQDFSNTASTNPISTKAVYSAVTDNELVWTNAFVALSGTVSAHTANTDIHVTAADKTAWNGAVTDSHTHSNKSALDSITGNVGTMAYEAANSYSSATEVNTALGNKLEASDVADFFDDAKYELSGTTHVINFYNDNAIKATIDAEPFIVDGMVESVSAVTSGNTTVLDIKWNTAAGGQETIIDIGDIFEADNYYQKSETSGATELSTAFAGKADTATTLAGYGITDAYTKSETSGATELATAFGDINDIIGSGFTSSSITDVIIENESIASAAFNDLNTNKLDVTAYTPVDLSNYYTKSQTSGASEISTALSDKASQTDLDTLSGTVTSHTASINDLSGQSETVAAALVNLSEGISGIESALGGVKIMKITKSDYDNLQTKDPNTLYFVYEP